MQSTLIRVLRLGAASAVLVALGAAGPDSMQVQIGDVGPLAQVAPSAKQPLTFQNTMYQAAPIPNEDVQAPPGAIRTEAQLSPKVLSPNALFQGDGYSYGSSQQGSLEARKTGAAGVGLSVPVQQ